MPSFHLVDEAATLAFGASLAPLVEPGLVFYLSGELGSGKTTLVRGMLIELGYQGRVRSPTYTLVEPYYVSKLDFYHFDFYRLRDPKEWEEAGFREYFNRTSVCVIEWPEKALGVLPSPDFHLIWTAAGSGRVVELSAQSSRAERLLDGWRPSR